MRRKQQPGHLFFMLVLCLSVLPSSCQAPNPPLDDDIATSFSGAILRLTDTTVTLPNSLLDPESQSPGRSASGKAPGDATVITEASIPNVRSDEWAILRKGDAVERISALVIKSIKGYASTHDIREGVIFHPSDDVGGYLEIIFTGARAFLTWTDTQNFKVAGTVSDFTVYGHIAIIATQGADTINVDLYFRLSIDNSTATPSTELCVEYLCGLNGGPAVFQFHVYGTRDGASGEANTVGLFDPTSGIYKMICHTQVSGRTITRQAKSMQERGGVLDSTVLQVAHGDDDIGGFLATQDTVLDPSLNYLMTEFYDGDGDLIMNTEGETDPFFLAGTEDETNISLLDASLSLPPETIRIKGEYLAGSWTYSYEVAGNTWKPYWRNVAGQYEVSTDGGVTWAAGPQSAGTFLYFKKNAEWQLGEGKYSWISQYMDGGVQYTSYRLALKVSEPIVLDGESFYTTKYFSLKKLLPLTPAYASIYQLIQLEGASNSCTWTDLDGVMHTTLVPTYTYFLDSDGDRNFDGLGSSDIELNTLQHYGGLSWNGSEFEKVQIYKYLTNISPPPYFQNPESAAVQALQSQLLSLAAVAKNLDYDAYSPNLEQLSIDAEFSDLN